jgi:hypothetical protein
MTKVFLLFLSVSLSRLKERSGEKKKEEETLKTINLLSLSFTQCEKKKEAESSKNLTSCFIYYLFSSSLPAPRKAPHSNQSRRIAFGSLREKGFGAG